MARHSGGRIRAARFIVLGLLAAAFVTLLAQAAGAALTTPANGATVRGTSVTITENSGGQDNCIFGNSGDDTRILIDGVVRFTKGDGGSYSVTWNTLNPPTTNGTHTITSQGRNISNGFFNCSTGSYYTISTHTVTVDNRSFITYTGATSGTHGNSVTLSATVSLEAGATHSPGGRTVNFTVGSQSTSAVTNASGVASTTLTLTQPSGSYSVTASYAGDAFYRASSASTGFSIGRRTTNLAYTGDTNGYWNENGTLSARLTDAATGTGVAGKTIGFSLGTFSSSAVTDAGGNASVTAPLSQLPGGYTAAASFAADSTHASSNTSSAFSILKRPTALAYTGDVSGYWNETATVTAVLTDVRNGAPIAGKTVAFALGSATANGTTDANGVATALIALTEPAGGYTVSASFTEDSGYLSSADAAAFTTLLRPTTLTYSGDVDGFWNEDATVTATLTDDRAGGIGVAGKTIVFTLGSQTAGATTDANGVATTTIAMPDFPGGYTVGSAFTADGNYDSSSDTDAFTILKRPTTLTYDGATQGFRGHTVTLSATLIDTRDGSGLAGKTVHFELGSFSGDATTGGNGQATVDVLLDQDPGSYSANVSFSEDSGYLGSVDSRTFSLDWEHVFEDGLDRGVVNINVSTREWQFVGGTDDTGIMSSGMTVLKAPDGFELPDVPPAPEPPCDPSSNCVPPLPPLPCDPAGDPAGCVPPAPTVPECADDPTGGDPICPADYVPPPPVAAASEQTCVDNPMGGDPICLPEAPPAPCDPTSDPAGCVPPLPEPPELPCDPTGDCVPPLPEPPCDPASNCLPALPCGDAESCEALAACNLPQATGCSDRFVLISFAGEQANGRSIQFAGLFDLQTGVWAAVARTERAPYQLGSAGSFTPCDFQSGDCTPTPPPVPPVPSDLPTTAPSDLPTTAPSDLPTSEPTPPTAPCDPTVDPTACVPPPPAA